MSEHTPRLPNQQVNVGDLERWLSLVAGGALILYGLRRSLGHLALVAGGGTLVYRGLRGYCPVYKTLGVSTGNHNSPHELVLEGTVVVNKPVAEVYQFWRRLENHPRFMRQLESVQSTSNTRSHWVAKTPLRTPVAWDSEIVDERENALLAWHSLPGSDIDHAGLVRFRELPGGRGTDVRLRLTYAPPGGTAGAAVGKLVQSFTIQQLQEGLRRFKQILEAGEIPTTDQQSSGRVAMH
jgi:uncharacterized membrane protein